MKKYIKSLVSLFLCLSCLMSIGTAAFAKLLTTDPPASTGEETVSSIINEPVLAEKVQALITQYSDAGFVKADQISVAYTYLATGDSWYLNPDTWFYSASMYKVPLMMILAERESKGELSPDSVIEGFNLAQGEEAVLVNSSNDAAHAVFRYISGKTDKASSEKETRPLYKAYASLPDDYYHSDFVNYSYFSARFMNEVMETLYNEPNRFPHIMNYLKLAMPGQYCRLKLEGIYEIAQKYGYYQDKQNNTWNNITAIVYTPNPFAMTVMTDNAPKAEQFIGDMAELLANYTLQLDSELAAHKEALAQAEAERIAAEEAAAQAEADRIAQEEADRLKREAEKKAEEERKIKEAEDLKKAEERKALMSKLLKYIGIAGGAVLLVLIVIGVLSALRKRVQKEDPDAFIGRSRRGLDDYDEDEDDYEDEEEDDEEDDDEDIPVRFSQKPSLLRRKPVVVPQEDDEDEDDEDEDNEDEDEEDDDDYDADRQASRFAALMRKNSESSSRSSSGGYVPKH